MTASANSCAWTATSSAEWAILSEGTTGTGTSIVRYGVSANVLPSPRGATIAVAGSTHTITQEAQPITCTYVLTPSAASASSDGGTGTFTVSAPAACRWAARSSESWLTVTGGADGSGDGLVSYRAAVNDGTAERTASIDVEGRRFTLTQAGRLPVQCDFAVAPVSFSPCMASGSVTTRVTAPASCAWTVTSSASWLTITTGGTGSGSGDITANYSSNYTRPRLGTLMVRWPSPTAGQNVQVAQAGCTYAAVPAAISLGPAGGASSFDVYQASDPIVCGGPTQDRCVWTAASEASWITVTTSMPAFGDATVRMIVAPNASGATRVGTIRIMEIVVEVTQRGA